MIKKETNKNYRFILKIILPAQKFYMTPLFELYFQGHIMLRENWASWQYLCTGTKSPFCTNGNGKQDCHFCKYSHSNSLSNQIPWTSSTMQNDTSPSCCQEEGTSSFFSTYIFVLRFAFKGQALGYVHYTSIF